jgi:molecular chaperone DnaK (HSP70)
MTEMRSNLRICRACGIWKLAADDVYCSYCGERVAKLEASLSDNVVYFGRLGAYGELVLSLENQGQTDITMDFLSIEHEWVKPIYDKSVVHPSGRQGLQPPFLLSSGSKWDIPLKIELTQTSSYYTCNVQITTVAGTEQVKIEILPKPKLTLHLEYPLDSKDQSKITDAGIELDRIYAEDEVPVCYLIRSPRSEKESWNCYLEIQESFVNLETIDVGIKENGVVRSPVIRISDHQKLPLTLDPAGIRRLNFVLDVDVSSLPKGESTYVFWAGCSKIQEPLVGKFVINHNSRPDIEFMRASGDKIVLQDEMLVRREDDFKDISIDLANPGDITITIAELDINSDWFELLSEIPKSIRSGQTDKLQFRVKTGKFLPELMQTDESLQMKAELILKFHCFDYPDYKIPDRKIEIVTKIALMPEYEGILAVDFGTANSCCAVESGIIVQQSNMVPLESSNASSKEGKEILPSVIYYRTEDDGNFDYIVGNQAVTFSMMPDTSPCTVRSIKRRLGQREHVGIMLDESKRHVGLLPEQITGHIIQYMIDATEKHLQRRITRCVVTHPARFFRPQIRALEKAFCKECGIEVSAFINEAVASALDAILEQERSDKPEYTVIVYDFGGGTTDIALLRVSDSVGADGIREIVPETLGVDGKRRLGGDDVTNRIAGLIIDKCIGELNRSGMGELIYKPVEQDDGLESIKVPEGMDILELRNAVSVNMLNIINAAEEHKKRLSSENESRLPLLNISYISKEDKIEVYPFSIEITEKEMNALVEDDIRDAMSLASDIIHTANERDNLSIEYADIFVLSGMSSRLPIVKRVAEEIFSNSRVWLHPEPKACVARGAYMIHAMSQLPAMVSIDTALLKAPPPTSAQYGIMVYGMGGEPVFRKAIPKGAKLPAEGVIGGFRIGRKTSITVYENPGTNISDPEIRKIAVCRLNVPESVSDKDLRSAQVFMRLEDEMTLKIILRVADKEYEFLAEVEPYI